VTDPDRTLRKGAIGVLGTFRDMPRWMRRLFTGVGGPPGKAVLLPSQRAGF